MDPEIAEKYVDFQHPPVVEVVCGLTFDTLGLTNPHLGRLWSSFGDSLVVEEQPPLPAVLERPDGQLEALLEARRAETPMARVWFKNESNGRLIQVQRDRFVYNWRGVNEGDEYPGFRVVFKEFADTWTTFRTFCKEQLGEDPSLRQYELTYINHIYEKDAEAAGLPGLRNVLSDFSWRPDAERFLPSPQGLSSSFWWDLPGGLGRLRMKAQSAHRTSNKDVRLLVVEMTARGYHSQMGEWFGQGREWIVKGFADLVNERVQESVWGRML